MDHYDTSNAAELHFSQVPILRVFITVYENHHLAGGGSMVRL